MPITKCLISVELADAVRKISLALGQNIPKEEFLCPVCEQPLSPHVSSDDKQVSHFEHFSGHGACMPRAGAAS
jgi:hypothetical protein